MKVLFLANRLPHANVVGGHRLVYHRMRQLAANGHQIGLAAFVLQEDTHHIQGLRDEFFEVETVPVNRRYLAVRLLHDYLHPTLPAIFWKHHSTKMMRLVGDLVKRSSYEIVVAEFGEMGMYLHGNPYLSAVNKMVSCHRCLSDSFRKYIDIADIPLSIRLKSAVQVRKLERYEFKMYSAMDHVLVLTPEDRFTLLNYAPQLPVSVIAPGVDLKYLHRRSTATPDPPQLMMCGYFADKSNQDAALWFMRHIWPLLTQKHQLLKCVFVGKGISHEMEHACQKYLNASTIGEVDDLRPYREKATIFINPMRLGSGLRVKVLEAMATGLPVVTTSLGAAGIEAQNGTNCFISDTPEGFSASISWLLSDSSLARRFGDNAREMVERLYDMANSAHNLERVLAKVSSARPYS